MSGLRGAPVAVEVGNIFQSCWKARGIRSPLGKTQSTSCTVHHLAGRGGGSRCGSCDSGPSGPTPES